MYFFETIELMRDRAVRRVPVIDDEGTLVGLVASDDALELLAESTQKDDLKSLIERKGLLNDKIEAYEQKRKDFNDAVAQYNTKIMIQNKRIMEKSQTTP